MRLFGCAEKYTLRTAHSAVVCPPILIQPLSLKQCIAMLKLKPGAILADGSPPPSLLLPPCSQPRLLCHQGCQPREKVRIPTFKISCSFLNYFSGLASSASSVLSHLPSLAPVSPTSFLAGNRAHTINKLLSLPPC